MIGEDFALMAAWDGLKRALSAYWGRKTKKRRKELISTVVAELLKLDPDLTAAEAKLAAAELTGEPPDRELLRAKTMLGSAKLYSRVRKKTKAKKYVFAPKKKRAIKKVAKKKNAMMEPVVGIVVPSPLPAQLTAHQPFRRLLGRSLAWEGVFVLQPQVPNSRKSSSRHEAPVPLPYPPPKGSSYQFFVKGKLAIQEFWQGAMDMGIKTPNSTS